MAKIPYAVIAIKISGDENKINGPDEIHLGDEVYDLMDSLREWLKCQSVNLDFEVVEQDDAG